jgi:hypothetical protein
MILIATSNVTVVILQTSPPPTLSLLLSCRRQRHIHYHCSYPADVTATSIITAVILQTTPPPLLSLLLSCRRHRHHYYHCSYPADVTANSTTTVVIWVTCHSVSPAYDTNNPQDKITGFVWHVTVISRTLHGNRRRFYPVLSIVGKSLARRIRFVLSPSQFTSTRQPCPSG